MKHIKHCKKCNKDKPLSEYQKYIKDGLNIGQSYCKDCRNEENNWSKKSNPQRMFVNGKYIPNNHPLHKAGNYKTFEGAAFASLSNYEKSTDGYVYLITNPAWKGWVKVGMAVDANDRCNQYQTSSPMRDYKLEYKKQFNHRRIAESQAHKLCGKKALQQNGEWFKININDAINLIESITEEQNDRETA